MKEYMQRIRVNIFIEVLKINLYLKYPLHREVEILQLTETLLKLFNVTLVITKTQGQRG